MTQYPNKLIFKLKWLSKLSAILFSATLPFCLTGCMGIYEGGFECPAGKGVGCKSISEVNTMVNQCSVPSVQSSEEKKEPSEIWYSPSFIIEQQEKRKGGCFDASNSPGRCALNTEHWHPWALEEI